MQGRPTILLVDDEHMIMSTTADVLRSAGFEVHTCDDWPKVASTIRSCNPDLVLLDYNMPTVKGDQICSSLKRNMIDRELKIVIYSSEDEAYLRSIVAQCGADGYLSKIRGVAHVVDGVCSFLS